MQNAQQLMLEPCWNQASREGLIEHFENSVVSANFRLYKSGIEFSFDWYMIHYLNLSMRVAPRATSYYPFWVVTFVGTR